MRNAAAAAAANEWHSLLWTKNTMLGKRASATIRRRCCIVIGVGITRCVVNRPRKFETRLLPVGGIHASIYVNASARVLEFEIPRNPGNRVLRFPDSETSWLIRVLSVRLLICSTSYIVLYIWNTAQYNSNLKSDVNHWQWSVINQTPL